MIDTDTEKQQEIPVHGSPNYLCLCFLCGYPLQPIARLVSSERKKGVMRNGLSSSSSSVLDSGKGELVRAAQQGVKPEKALIALRNHSEAERRRRERINGHFTTLRSLIPGSDRMDKAALLAKVISQIK